MFQTPRFSRPSRQTSRGGFTLVELLVVIGIIAILAGVALGPITNGINKAKQSTGMQNSRSIALLCFQYAIDNDSTYPCGTTALGYTTVGMAKELLQNKYVSDPNQFYNGGTGKTKGTANASDGFTGLVAANVSWDSYYVPGGTGGTPTGMTSSSSDLLPLIYCTGNVAPVPINNVASDLTLAAANTYGNDGIAVCYKSNSAKFITGTISSGGSAVVTGFIAASFNDSTTYAQLKPQ